MTAATRGRDASENGERLLLLRWTKLEPQQQGDRLRAFEAIGAVDEPELREPACAAGSLKLMRTGVERHKS